MKNILVIVDKGDVWEITGTTVQASEYVVDPELVKEIPVDQQGIAIFNYIKSQLRSKKLQFSKELSGRMIVEDLIEVPHDENLVYREGVIQKGREYLNTRLGIHSVFEFFDFIMLNNKLLAAGFFITEKNRREKYLEIIDTGDIELIDALESYLNALDTTNILNGWYRTYKEFEKNVLLADDRAAVEDCWKAYVQIFE